MQRGASKIALTVVALAAAAVTHAQSSTRNISGYVTLTSDYRSRGLSQSAGDPALQLGLDFQHATGFFAGGTAVTGEYERYPFGPGDTSHRTELAGYAGYARRLREWSFTAAAGVYAYTGSAFDYDYRELSGTIAWRNTLSLTSSHLKGVAGSGDSARNRELALALPLGRRVELGAAVGRFEADAWGIDYTHWNAGISKVVGPFGVDVRYYDNGADRTSPFGAPAAGEWVFSASYGFDVR